MSGYSHSSSEHSSYPCTASTAAYSTSAVPQYIQSQINTYYHQYQRSLPQPYQIVPDYLYSPPVTVVPPNTFTETTSPGYSPYTGVRHGEVLDPKNVAPPTDEETLRRGSSPRPGQQRTWICMYPGCTSSAKFTRLADLQRHESTVHGAGTPDFPCTVPHCARIGNKGFTRRDHLMEHLRNFHHLDIPKRRPGERSALPFGLPPYQS